jgi:hypothetical protein
MELSTVVKEINPENKKYRRERLQALAESLLKKRDEAVRFRAGSGVERRWREDQRAFDMLADITKDSMIDYATGEAPRRTGGGPVRSMAKVNIIRGKCEVAEGRFSDIQLPTDDRNYGLKPTPKPDLVKGLLDERQPIDTTTGQPMVDDAGNPIKTSEIARVQMDEANKKMEAMQDEIDDQLTECGFNGECRKVVRDAVRLGTGVIKGPNVIKSIRKAWIEQSDGDGKTVWRMQSVEKHAPESKRVDIWNVFPDPQCGEDLNKAAYVWEVEEFLPRELRSLIGVEGYEVDQIKMVLQEEPLRTSVSINQNNKGYEVRQQAREQGTAYEKWQYTGDIDRDDLEVLGCDCEDLEGQALSACVVFVNDRPIKIQLNVLDTGDLGYDFFQWTQVAGSPWGIGIVRMSIWMQRVIIAALRAMMDNGRDSSGANIIVGKGVEPADGIWDLTGKKVWRETGGIDDVRKAFNQFQLQNNQRDLEAIIELALKFLDMETNIPMFFQGEKAEMPETLGQTNIMVDANNISERSRVKIWDDQITRTHITRYYHWNMQYNDNPDIKGDWNVDARGTSVLLMRDQQARSLINLMALRGDEKVDNEVDWGKATRELFKALKLDVLKSEADKKRDQEQKQHQPQPADPKIEAVKIRAEGELEKAQLVQNSDMAELQFKAEQAELERQHDREMKAMDYQIKMMEYAQQSGQKLDEIKADLAKEASKQNLMRELANKKTAQLTQPPIEPPQKAAAGEAYTQ